MTRRRIWMVCAGVLVLAGWALYALLAREPKYQDKTLKEWVLLLDRASAEYESTTQRQAQITQALTAMGDEALVSLVKFLAWKPPDSWVRKTVEKINASQNTVYFSLDREPDWPGLAGRALRLLGTNAIPVLTRPDFLNTLTNGNEQGQLAALAFLGTLGQAAASTAPLVEQLARSTNNCSELAMCALSVIDPNPERLLPLFEQQVRRNYYWSGGFALRQLGPAGIPAALRALTNDSRWVRTQALLVLSPDTFFEATSFEEKVTRYSAASSRFQNRRAGDIPIMVPALAYALKYCDEAQGISAVTNLAAYGIWGVPALAHAARHTNALVRQAAKRALDAFPFETRLGAVIRGPKDRKEIALVFTGHEFAEGGEIILDALARHNAKASFFLTGDFLVKTNFQGLVKRLVENGHYLGPHSDKHLLYCSWDAERTNLVTRRQFRRDLIENWRKVEFHERKNSPDEMMARYSVLPSSSAAPGTLPAPKLFFLPPFEHYNEDIALWTAEMGWVLVNFTPGTRSNADYTGEADRNFVPSQVIFDSIIAREQQDPNGLNGFLLLLHVGSGPGRTDKFPPLFGGLLEYLAGKGYGFVRIDEMLGSP